MKLHENKYKSKRVRNQFYFLFVWFVFGSFFMLSSCESKQQLADDELAYPPSYPQIIKWTQFNSLGFKNINFPIWFDAELLDLNQVQDINLEFFSYNPADTSNHEARFLTRQFYIKYNKNGDVKKIELTEFEDEQSIVSYVFEFQNPVNEHGYSMAKLFGKAIYQENLMTNIFSMANEYQQFQLLELISFDSTLIKFKNKVSLNDEFHYFLLDSSLWNVTYIDSDLNPKDNDVFYYGSPSTYSSAFSLQNLVNKTMRVEQSFYSNSVLKEQIFYMKDFYTKRSFFYDEKGLCEGYNDSLKSLDHTFISSEQTTVYYENEIPKKIVTSRENNKVLREIHISFIREE